MYALAHELDIGIYPLVLVSDGVIREQLAGMFIKLPRLLKGEKITIMERPISIF